MVYMQSSACKDIRNETSFDCLNGLPISMKSIKF